MRCTFLVLIGAIEGGGFQVRQEMKEAVEDNFGLFAFEQNVQVDIFPISLKTVPQHSSVYLTFGVVHCLGPRFGSESGQDSRHNISGVKIDWHWIVSRRRNDST